MMVLLKRCLDFKCFLHTFTVKLLWGFYFDSKLAIVKVVMAKEEFPTEGGAHDDEVFDVEPCGPCGQCSLCCPEADEDQEMAPEGGEETAGTVKDPTKDPDYLEMALNAEAAGLTCEVANPEDDLRRNQLLKKQQDRERLEAERKQKAEIKLKKAEEKKKQEEEKKKKKEEKEAAKKQKEEAKAEKKQKKKEAKKSRGKKAVAGKAVSSTDGAEAAEEPAAPADLEQDVPDATEDPMAEDDGSEGAKALPASSGAAAADPDHKEEPKKAAPKKRTRGTGNANGRPRKKDPAPEGEEETDGNEGNLHRRAKKRAKARATSGGHEAGDPEMVKELKEWMENFRTKTYDKTTETLRKIPGFNVYDKNRHAAGWKVPLPSKKGGHQVVYFSLTLDKVCSVAVNVWLTRKFFDKIKAENLDIAWADSEQGVAFYRLLVYTARQAESELN